MKKTRGGTAIKTLVALSALSAIGIILGKFLAFNVTEFMRFSLENISIIFAGIVFGPIEGLIVGAVQDLVGCLAVGYTINPIITLGCALTGCLSGLIYSLAKRVRFYPRVILSVIPAHLAGSVLVKTWGLSLFYSLPFVPTLLWRILNYVIVGSAEIIILSILLKSKRLLSEINKITTFSPNVKFKSYKDATDYAKNVSNTFSKPGLERVKALCGSVGSPERSVKVVHVTGTNGKGSVVAMLSSVLKEAKLKVGTFTSPYFFEMRESIRIQGEPISEERLVDLIERVSQVAETMADKPTEFELLTACAYLAFREEGVDVAVVECGMGGERDATNVIESTLISIITGISIDHISYLGSTEEEIAREKSGVIKRNCPVLVGDMGEGAKRVISDKASELDAEIYAPECARTISMTLGGTVIDTDDLHEVRIQLLGVHQVKNAAIVIKAAKILSSSFSSINDEAILHGLENAVWPGRFEILSRDPLFIFDGAHNKDGITNATKSVKSYFDKKVIVLTGVLADKDYRAIAESISEISDTVVTISPHSKRALDSSSYAEVFSCLGVNAKAEKTVEDGVSRALSIAKERALPVICLGSLYLYPDVIRAIKNR